MRQPKSNLIKYEINVEDKHTNSEFADYRELISEKNFLDVRSRANNIGEVNLMSADSFSKELNYSVPSETGAGSYHVRIVVYDLQETDTSAMAPGDINTLIRNSQLEVDCNCPAFLYWGFKYIGTVDGYSLFPENIPPNVRNPQQQGYVCKHIYRALQTYPFNVNIIRQALVG